jgi:hypothetical protein
MRRCGTPRRPMSEPRSGAASTGMRTKTSTACPPGTGTVPRRATRQPAEYRTCLARRIRFDSPIQPGPVVKLGGYSVREIEERHHLSAACLDTNASFTCAVGFLLLPTSALLPEPSTYAGDDAC